MKDIRYQLRTFLKLLLKKWILWLFFALDIIGLIVSIVFPQLTLPLPMYWGVALIGLLWASFQVYRDLVAQMPAQLQVLQLKPELALGLVEGNEYTYTLLDLESSPRYRLQRLRAEEEPESDDTRDEVYTLPDTLIVLHVRVSNLGPIGVDVLSVRARYDHGYKGPWGFSLASAKPVNADGQAIVFPVHLEPGGIMLCDLRSVIKPRPSYNVAQFAAHLSRIHLKSPNPVKTTISVEAMAPTTGISSFELVCEVVTRPLKDLYITLWQDENRSDLLRLAHAGEYTPASKPRDANTIQEE